MPREDDVRELSREWLRIAESNLRMASRGPSEGIRWEELCFEAQQAVEKAIKAVLVREQIDFPRTHDVGVLLDLVAASGRSLPPDEARDLTEFATGARYPGWPRVVTEGDYQEALGVATRVLAWARKVING